jgi:hypothetical protein
MQSQNKISDCSPRMPGWEMMRKSLIALFAACRLETDHTSYRPEKYYMRGPGPKWRAKHAGAPAGVRKSLPYNTETTMLQK